MTHHLHENCFVSMFPALPDGWYRFGSKLIKLFPDRRTWRQAQQFCESIGGELVSVNNKDENEFISHLFDQIKTNGAGDSYISLLFRKTNYMFLQVLFSSVADNDRLNMIN